MQTPKLNRMLRSVAHGGFYNTPLAILVADVGFRDRPRIVAMLYIKDAVRDKECEALHMMADSAYVADCAWYPVAVSDTILSALRDLEARLVHIRTDKKSMNEWFLDLYHAQFNITRHLEDKTDYIIDIEDLKLTQKPDYYVE